MLTSIIAAVALSGDIAATKPDYVVYHPEQVFADHEKMDPSKIGDSYNDHFQVLWDEKRKLYYAFWTQASWEGGGDHHICFSKSADLGKTWSKPMIMAGSEIRNNPKYGAEWQQPLLAKNGRLYLLWNQWARKGRGADVYLSGTYSDDGGVTWAKHDEAIRPEAKADAWTVPVYVCWINWQRPLRLGKDGRYFVGCSEQSRIKFWEFENIDENPEVRDIKITAYPENSKGVLVEEIDEKDVYHPEGRAWLEEASVVKLPDGRLFALMRSTTGHPVWSQSRDEGRTWSKGKFLRDESGRAFLQPCSPCPLYDWMGPEKGSGAYFALVHDTFDFENKKTAFQKRGKLYLIAGRFDPKGEQPIKFVRKKLFNPRDDGSNSCYSSFTVAGNKHILWYPDRKYYLMGKEIGKEWFK